MSPYYLLGVSTKTAEPSHALPTTNKESQKQQSEYLRHLGSAPIVPGNNETLFGRLLFHPPPPQEFSYKPHMVTLTARSLRLIRSFSTWPNLTDSAVFHS
ncbi:hypothetical protein NPIL_664571 [Nephila pilipes]|uniref:Uncharacterized protein n=1 Tax=Nephila pilipes TaxID=299642 RepID=A0A8X6UFI9_NEPPI|nr:hypothetical protein NPIL_664571 [Nephila pilipes]